MDKLQLLQSMVNSYNVIIRGYDPILMIRRGKGYFAHNPKEELDKEEVLGILEFFEEEEDYMKCVELDNFIKERWN